MGWGGRGGGEEVEVWSGAIYFLSVMPTLPSLLPSHRLCIFFQSKKIRRSYTLLETRMRKPPDQNMIVIKGYVVRYNEYL